MAETQNLLEWTKSWAKTVMDIIMFLILFSCSKNWLQIWSLHLWINHCRKNQYCTILILKLLSSENGPMMYFDMSPYYPLPVSYHNSGTVLEFWAGILYAIVDLHSGTHKWSFIKIWDGHPATFSDFGQLEPEGPRLLLENAASYVDI